MRKHFALFYFFFAFVSLRLEAQKPVVLDSQEKFHFGKNTSIFIDSSNTLTLNAVRERVFTPGTNNVFSPPAATYTYWVKFDIENRSDEKYYLVIDNAFINELELFSIGKDNEAKKQSEGGSMLPFQARQIKRNNYVFPLNLPHGEARTYYIRYKAVRAELPLILGTATGLFEFFEANDFLWGAFFGIFVIIIIYNIFLFISIRDIGYLLYITYILIFCVVRSVFTGYSFQYLFPNHPWLNDIIFSTNVLISVFGIWFGLNFLKVNEYYPKLNRVGQLFILLFLAEFVLAFIDKVLYFKLVSISLLASAPFMIIVGALVLRKGYTPARFYLIATTLFVVTIIISSLRNLGIIPHTFFTYHAINFGIVIEAILYSIALGDRYQLFRKEKESVQKELNRELKIKIKERAKNQEELKKINQSLIQTNHDLDSFIYTASHDLKSPMSNIEGIVNLLNSTEDEEERKELHGLILTSVEKFRNTIGDLTEISKIQQMHEESQQLSIQDAYNEVSKNLQLEIKNTDTVIHTDFSKTTEVYFSHKNLVRILENLLSNAIKFRSAARPLEISISTNKTTDHFVLSIQDNGIGISKDSQGKVFSLFKKAHSHAGGRGIGLYIVKRILENAGGKIEVESEEGKGSVFRAYFLKKGI